MPLEFDPVELFQNERRALVADVHEGLPLADVDPAHDFFRQPRGAGDDADEIAGRDIQYACGVIADRINDALDLLALKRLRRGLQLRQRL